MDVSQVQQLSHSLFLLVCFRTHPCIRATFTWRSSRSFASSSPAPLPHFKTKFQSYNYGQIFSGWRYQFLRAQGRHDIDRELGACCVCEGKFGAHKGQNVAAEESPQYKQAGVSNAHPQTSRSCWSFASAILRVASQLLSSDNALCHKDSSKSFPLGTPLPILKWKSGASADHFVPIKVVRILCIFTEFLYRSEPLRRCCLLPLMNNLTLCNSRAGPAPAQTPPP
jgi:hypothetical protein